jgi:hypothetical protein
MNDESDLVSAMLAVAFCAVLLGAATVSPETP